MTGASPMPQFNIVTGKPSGPGSPAQPTIQLHQYEACICGPDLEIWYQPPLAPQGVSPQRGKWYKPLREPSDFAQAMGDLLKEARGQDAAIYGPELGLDRLSGEAVGLDFIGQSWVNPLSFEKQTNYFIKLGQLSHEDATRQRVSVVHIKIVGGPKPNHTDWHNVTDELASSLKNIIEELKKEGFERPVHGVLTGWAEKGPPPQLMPTRYNPEMGLDRLSWEALGLDYIGQSWLYALCDEFVKPYFTKLARFVRDERWNHTLYPRKRSEEPPHDLVHPAIYPPAEETFAWTKHCKIDDVKVVIVGQDPYHGPDQAHGLCFSVKRSVGIPRGCLPSSLQSIFQELEMEGIIPPAHGDLTGWAEQGVLLLNKVLTVCHGVADSHKGHGWEKFTEAVIEKLCSNGRRKVFLLWGGKKKVKKVEDIINKSGKHHHILRSKHPSGNSNRNKKSTLPPFLGCGHFSKANELLKGQGERMINWGIICPPPLPPMVPAMDVPFGPQGQMYQQTAYPGFYLPS